jgi:hypothetical protein
LAGFGTIFLDRFFCGQNASFQRSRRLTVRWFPCFTLAEPLKQKSISSLNFDQFLVFLRVDEVDDFAGFGLEYGQEGVPNGG